MNNDKIIVLGEVMGVSTSAYDEWRNAPKVAVFGRQTAAVWLG